MDIEKTKHHIAAGICGKIYKELNGMILKDNPERDLKTLTAFGNNRIKEELSKIYKKEDKNIAYPVSISLNDIISNYIYDYTNEESEYNLIKDTDIIKIELGVSIGGCISILCETFTILENKPIKTTIDFLNDIKKDILEMIQHEETVDEIRIHIESKCTEYNVFPIENAFSYQHDNGLLTNSTAKYMVLNYRPKMDNNENYITPQNINFEFEENDIFTINLSVLPMEDDNDTIDIKYKYYTEDSHVYRLNDSVYNLRLKSSREFYNEISKNHSKYAFEINPYLSNIKYRLGMTECINKGVLEKYPIMTTKNKLPIVTKKFTILVGKDKSTSFKY